MANNNKNKAIQRDWTLIQLLYAFSSVLHTTMAYVQQHYRGKGYDEVWNIYEQMSKTKDEYQKAVEALILKGNKEDE